jgi:hypothetical protein
VKTGLGREPHRHQGGTGRGDHPVIGDVIGLWHDHLIAKRRERQHGGAQGILGSGGEYHLLGEDVAAGAP